MFHRICKPSILVFLKYKTGKYMYMHFGKTYNLFNRILWSRKAGFNAMYKYTQCIMANYFTQPSLHIFNIYMLYTCVSSTLNVSSYKFNS